MATFNLIGWLYRPYLDLGPCMPDAPLHVFGIEFEYCNLMEEAQLPRINSVMMPSFREAVINEACAPEYLANNLNLRSALRTKRYEALSNKIKDFEEICLHERAYVFRLLNKMCLYELTLSLAHFPFLRWDADAAEIEFQKLLANNILSLENSLFSFNLAGLQKLAHEAPAGSEAKINALYQIEIYYIKQIYDPKGAAYWAEIHKNELIKAKYLFDEFTYYQFMSRFHRVNGFIPQMNNDKDGVIHEMNLAELYASKLMKLASFHKNHQQYYEVSAREMLYPVFESRTKEALWLEDFPQAEERAYRFVEMCPFDPRARLNLAQVLLEQEKIKEAPASFCITDT